MQDTLTFPQRAEPMHDIAVRLRSALAQIEYAERGQQFDGEVFYEVLKDAIAEIDRLRR